MAARACVALSLALTAVVLGAPAARAQPHRHARAHPPPPRLAVVRAEESSLRRARTVAPAFVPRVAQCVHAAHAVDPVGLAAVLRATATIQLAHDGRASAVEISPSHLARGLSACLATELLEWRQEGYVGLHGAVLLALSLEP